LPCTGRKAQRKASSVAKKKSDGPQGAGKDVERDSVGKNDRSMSEDSILSMFRGEEDTNVIVDEQEAPAPKSRTKSSTKSAASDHKSDTSAPGKKNRPTRSRAEATTDDTSKRTGFGEFLSQVVQELKKVSWPTSAQLFQYFLVVLAFVVFMIAFISLLDFVFSGLMLKIFGGG